MDEKERLASASYVNYGPTTSNGLAELQAREIMEKPSSEGGTTGEMLRSSLEDGFKAMFPSMQQPAASSLSQAVNVSKMGPTTTPYVYGIYPGFSPYSMNQFLHHQQQLQLRQQQQQVQQQAQLCQRQQMQMAAGNEGEWLGLNPNPSPAPHSGVIGAGVAKKTGDVAMGTKQSIGEFLCTVCCIKCIGLYRTVHVYICLHVGTVYHNSGNFCVS